MQRALRISEQRVQTLEKDIRQMENSALKRQKDSQLGEMSTSRVEVFKQVIDNIRDMVAAQRDKDGNSRVTKKLMEHAFGYAKEYVGQKMNMQKEKGYGIRL